MTDKEMRGRGISAAVLAAVLFSTACRKPAKPAPQPPAGVDSAALSMHEEAKAEAEVSASSGPVKVTIRVYKTRIKKGQSLWLQIVYTNVGSAPLMIEKDEYTHIHKLFAQERGLGLRLLDSEGHDTGAFLARPMEVEPALDCMTDEERAPWDRFHDWVKGGSKPQNFKGAVSESPVTWLSPGESLASQAWAYQSDGDRYCMRLPPPKLTVPFSEVPLFQFYEPGKYRLYGAYNTIPSFRPSKDFDEVKFRSAAIELEILP